MNKMNKVKQQKTTPVKKQKTTPVKNKRQRHKHDKITEILP